MGRKITLPTVSSPIKIEPQDHVEEFEDIKPPLGQNHVLIVSDHNPTSDYSDSEDSIQQNSYPIKRGRPPKSVDPLHIKRPRGRPPTAPEYVNVPALNRNEVKDTETKYHRTRILNNAASKRCRVKKKSEMIDVGNLEKELLVKNELLKIQADDLERKLSKLKNYLIHNQKSALF